jgi:hypothetical protein
MFLFLKVFLSFFKCNQVVSVRTVQRPGIPAHQRNPPSPGAHLRGAQRVRLQSQTFQSSVRRLEYEFDIQTRKYVIVVVVVFCFVAFLS